MKIGALTIKLDTWFASVIYWTMLRRSRIFNYWYRKFLNDLLHDIQIADFDNKAIMGKYQNKLSKSKNYKAGIKP